MAILSCRAWPLLRWMLAATGGALLTVLGFLFYYLSGGLAASYPPLAWSSASMTVVLGQGQPMGDGLEIRRAGPDPTVMVWFTRHAFVARPYGKLVWNIEGLAAGQDARLIWTVQSQSGVVHQTILSPDALEQGQIDLRAQPGWDGYVTSMGLTIRDVFARPVYIRRVELIPTKITVAGLLQQAWVEWTTSEYWSQRSTHYISGAPRQALFHPIIMVIVWILISMVLDGFRRWTNEQRFFSAPALVLWFLVGWWVIDLRWQVDLLQRLCVTHERFAGRSEIDKKLAADDGRLFQFLHEVRERLPVYPVRVFIFNDDPANRAVARNYMVARSRYHLMPHNSYADVNLITQLNRARADDFILVLRPDQGRNSRNAALTYDPNRSVLAWGQSQLPVDLLYREPLGALFRVR